MTTYQVRLHAAVANRGTPLIVGLDPRWEQLPEPLKTKYAAYSSDRFTNWAAAFEEFCIRVIDVVSPLVPAVKPQSAFFEDCGPLGTAVLGRVIRHARESGLLVICDAKRGDIGSTAEAYARGYLAGADIDAAPWGADALTVSPYLGRDTLEPFVRVAVERGAGIYVLVRTSNPGAGTFQDLTANGQTVYQRVAQAVEELNNEVRSGHSYGPIGAVVGATFPRELGELRQLMPHAPLLIPGYGSQGGTAADVQAGFDGAGQGAVVNSSRAILFAHSRKDLAGRFAPDQWEQAVELATREAIADLKTVVTPQM